MGGSLKLLDNAGLLVWGCRTCAKALAEQGRLFSNRVGVCAFCAPASPCSLALGAPVAVPLALIWWLTFIAPGGGSP